MNWFNIFKNIPQDEATQREIQMVLREVRDSYEAFRIMLQRGVINESNNEVYRRLHTALGKYLELIERYS